MCIYYYYTVSGNVMNMGGLKILYLTKEGQCPPGRAVKNDTSKNSFISKQEKLYVLNKLPL